MAPHMSGQQRQLCKPLILKNAARVWLRKWQLLYFFSNLDYATLSGL